MSGLFGKGQHTSQSEERIGAMRVQTSAYGAVIPIVWGVTRVSGNMFWYGDFTPIAHTETSSQGGKGGDVTSSNTTYTYTTGLMFGLCEGTLLDVAKIWANKNVYDGAVIPTQIVEAVETYTVAGNAPTYNVAHVAAFYDDVSVARQSATYTPGVGSTVYLTRTTGAIGADSYKVTSGSYTFNAANAGAVLTITYRYTVPGYTLSALQEVGLTLLDGSYTQSAWSWLTTNHPDEALAYRGQAAVVANAFDLKNSTETPNMTFEVSTTSSFGNGIVDANPKDVVTDYLSNANYGTLFPAALLGNYATFGNYCTAANLFISPALTEQREGQEWLAEFARCGNSELVWSEGLLKIVPYGDANLSGNGASYTANVTPVYALTDDDYLGEIPVRVTRKPSADRFNSVQVEFTNRANDYNTDIASAQDQANIEIFGLRQTDVVKLPMICDATIARNMAQLILQRALYIPSEYRFDLSWKYCLLEPMDLVTLTDSALGLAAAPVRITEVSEDADGKLSITAEDFPGTVASAPLYAPQPTAGYAANYNATAGNISTPVIFEPPDALASGLQIWTAAAGLENWGGYCLWVSSDGGVTYTKVDTVYGAAREGVLSAALASATGTDQTNTLSVDLTASEGALASALQTDADQLRTSCYVDGEIICYGVATLTDSYEYDLSYLVRGAFGSTEGAHAAGTQFARLDNAVSKQPFTVDDIGRTLSLKFQSFNPFGTGFQDLADLPTYHYTITGSAFNTDLPDVENLTTNYIANVAQLHWDAVTDFRAPIDYEVRSGGTWETAQVLGTTPLTSFAAVGDGTYWVSAHYLSPAGVNVYSAIPQELVIAGSIFSQNVLASWDERATGWTGNFGGGAMLLGSVVELGGGGNILTLADFLAASDIIWYGGVSSSGSYTLPAAHHTNAGRVALCNVAMRIDGAGLDIHASILPVVDFLGISDLLGVSLGALVTFQPQIRTAGADAIFGAWENFSLGGYNAQYFDARVNLSTSSSEITPVMSNFVVTVDVPDRIDTATAVVIAAGGANVVYSAPFNINPNVQITILSAQAGDQISLTNSVAAGFSVQLLNAGNGVQRSINWFAQGY